MKKIDARLKVLEIQTLTCMLLRDKRWLHGLTDLELATLTATAPALDAEIFILVLEATEDELRRVAHAMGRPAQGLSGADRPLNPD